MEIRIQKALLKTAIDCEGLFCRMEKDCLKLIVELACSIDELIVIAVFCCWKRQRMVQVLF